jgi:hypothetical protein
MRQSALNEALNKLGVSDISTTDTVLIIDNGAALNLSHNPQSHHRFKTH